MEQSVSSGQHVLTDGPYRAAIAAAGAELIGFAHTATGDVLWPAGPAWPNHAPILFPIVGQLAGDQLTVDGRSYAMGRHGFARRSTFTWTQRDAASCALELRDSDATRAAFPFAFVFTVRYALDAVGLQVTFDVHNPGDAVLPVSAGAHPAFRWPLAQGRPKTDYRLTFERDEPAPIRRLRDGLLDPAGHPSPVEGRELRLRDELFVDDAVIMLAPASRRVRYDAGGGPALSISWDGFEQLGIWTKPGADFVCIEPWRGYASPSDFAGDFRDKPGLMHIAPGAGVRLRLGITIEP